MGSAGFGKKRGFPCNGELVIFLQDRRFLPKIDERWEAFFTFLGEL